MDRGRRMERELKNRPDRNIDILNCDDLASGPEVEAPAISSTISRSETISPTATVEESSNMRRQQPTSNVKEPNQSSSSKTAAKKPVCKAKQSPDMVEAAAVPRVDKKPPMFFLGESETRLKPNITYTKGLNALPHKQMKVQSLKKMTVAGVAAELKKRPQARNVVWRNRQETTKRDRSSGSAAAAASTTKRPPVVAATAPRAAALAAASTMTKMTSIKYKREKQTRDRSVGPERGGSGTASLHCNNAPVVHGQTVEVVGFELSPASRPSSKDGSGLKDEETNLGLANDQQGQILTDNNNLKRISVSEKLPKTGGADKREVERRKVEGVPKRDISAHGAGRARADRGYVAPRKVNGMGREGANGTSGRFRDGSRCNPPTTGVQKTTSKDAILATKMLEQQQDPVLLRNDIKPIVGTDEALTQQELITEDDKRALVDKKDGETIQTDFKREDPEDISVELITEDDKRALVDKKDGETIQTDFKQEDPDDISVDHLHNRMFRMLQNCLVVCDRVEELREIKRVMKSQQPNNNAAEVGGAGDGGEVDTPTGAIVGVSNVNSQSHPEAGGQAEVEGKYDDVEKVEDENDETLRQWIENVEGIDCRILMLQNAIQTSSMYKDGLPLIAWEVLTMDRAFKRWLKERGIEWMITPL